MAVSRLTGTCALAESWLELLLRKGHASRRHQLEALVDGEEQGGTVEVERLTDGGDDRVQQLRHRRLADEQLGEVEEPTNFEGAPLGLARPR